MEAKEVNRRIWEKFHIKKYDNCPSLRGWKTPAALLLRNCWVNLRQGEPDRCQDREVFARTAFPKPESTYDLCRYWAAYARVIRKQDSFYRRCQQRLAGYKADLMRMASMDAVGK